MKRSRPRRPRVKLNRAAGSELLSLLHMTQTELAQLCGLDPEGDVKAQFLEWRQVREGVVSGDVHYKAVLDAARIKARRGVSRKDAGLAWPRARRSWAGTSWRPARASPLHGPRPPGGGLRSETPRKNRRGGP